MPARSRRIAFFALIVLMRMFGAIALAPAAGAIDGRLFV
jgi:hypothetical protein